MMTVLLEYVHLYLPWLQGTANINKGLGTILYPVGCTLQSDGCGFALLVQGREIIFQYK